MIATKETIQDLTNSFTFIIRGWGGRITEIYAPCPNKKKNAKKIAQHQRDYIFSIFCNYGRTDYTQNRVFVKTEKYRFDSKKGSFVVHKNPHSEQILRYEQIKPVQKLLKTPNVSFSEFEALAKKHCQITKLD